MGNGKRYAEWALVFAAGCVAGWLWAIRPGVLAEIDWVQVMIALGTVGATSVAAWSSMEAHKREDCRVSRERATKEAEAKIIALQAFSWVSACAGMAGQIRDLLEPAQKSVPVPFINAKTALRLTDEALEFLDRIPEVHLLSYLPERCGERIAYGHGQLVYIQQALKNQLAEPRKEFSPYWERGAMLSLMASEACNFFSSAGTQIQGFALMLPMKAPGRA